MLLVTVSSLFVPVIGLATAPILTHSLGVGGRGEAGAAIAPNLLIVGGATLGLPQALTYYVAKRPYLVRSALGWASLFTSMVGGVALVVTFCARSYLSGGDGGLAHLMLLGMWLSLPALLVGLLRGAAAGRQMWRAVAAERVINSVLRLLLLGGLAIFGKLDVTAAVMVMCLGPVIAGVVYVGVVAESPVKHPEVSPASWQQLPRDLLAFGSPVWFGSVAVILTARLSQLLVTPLSNVEQLGLLIVAITISDVPFLVTQTIRDVSFGANSAESDTARLLATSRLATLASVAGSAVLGITLPLWIDVMFGAGFEAAIVPTWLLLAASCISVPGLIAGAGLDSAGRPGLKSVSLVLGLVANLVGLFALVPLLGATGAALAALAGTLISTAFAIVAASRVLGTASGPFFIPRGADVALLSSSVVAIGRRARIGRRT